VPASASKLVVWARRVVERGAQIQCGKARVVPVLLRGSGLEDAARGGAYVAGTTAASLNFNVTMKANLPFVFTFVLGLAFLLLLWTFRSLVIPLKTILLNLLSVGAAYGLTTLVFQHGKPCSRCSRRSTRAQSRSG
jgi:uncharacterized membrane protein YdfJ with MMPL/SSD domain